jgi:hypothetical protein
MVRIKASMEMAPGPNSTSTSRIDYPVDVQRPPHRRRDVDLQQHRQGEQASGSEAGGKSDQQADRQHKLGITEEISGGRRGDRQLCILRLEQLESRLLDGGRQRHREVDPGGGHWIGTPGPSILAWPDRKKTRAMTRRNPSASSA